MVTTRAEAPPKLKTVVNWINGAEKAAGGKFFVKRNPHNGEPIFRVAGSTRKEVNVAVAAAAGAQPAWADLPPPRRGEILRDVATLLQKNRQEIARIVSLETGKSPREALAETDGAVSLGFFFAGEGQRLYGKTAASGSADRQVTLVRRPIGVAGLIVPANTPIANVAWKVFPALVCGNAAVLKAAEDAPRTAWVFGRIALEAGLPAGVLQIVQGSGEDAGAALVDHPAVGVLSFTGRAETGRKVAMKAAERFCRVSLELGGKNPLVVCDDADLEGAVSWTLLSAFSNAGQRCSAASRVIVFDGVYERFCAALLEKTRKLRAGPTDGDDLGPLINEKQLERALSIVEQSKKKGARILTGGNRLTDSGHAAGYYMAPTLVENADPKDEISTAEIFAPVAALYRVKDLREALVTANASPYGLTAAIHTQNLHRAHWFAERVEAGVVSINGGTYGSEPHLPFGGLKRSGNGSREPGTEALDVYTELKNIYLNINPEKI